MNVVLSFAIAILVLYIFPVRDAIYAQFTPTYSPFKNELNYITQNFKGRGVRLFQQSQTSGLEPLSIYDNLGNKKIQFWAYDYGDNVPGTSIVLNRSQYDENEVIKWSQNDTLLYNTGLDITINDTLGYDLILLYSFGIPGSGNPIGDVLRFSSNSQCNFGTGIGTPRGNDSQFRVVTDSSWGGIHSYAPNSFAYKATNESAKGLYTFSSGFWDAQVYESSLDAGARNWANWKKGTFNWRMGQNSTGRLVLYGGTNATATSPGNVRLVFDTLSTAIGLGFDNDTESFADGSNLFAKKSLNKGNGEVNIELFDKTSAAAGVGGKIKFSGWKTGTGSAATFAEVEGIKSNNTAGNENGDFSIRTNLNGTGLREALRITADKNILLNGGRYFVTPSVNLTEGVATTIFTLDMGVAQPSVSGGQIYWTIWCNDGDAPAVTQGEHHETRFISVYSADVINVVQSSLTSLQHLDAGTLTTTESFVQVDNTVQFKLNSTSSLTQTVLKAQAVIFINYGSGIK